MAAYTAEQAKRFALERKQRNAQNRQLLQQRQPQQAQQGRRGFEASSLIQEGGALGGAIGGATLGASLGSVVPGIGTAIGGLLGAGIGGFTGSFGGGLTESKVRDNKFDVGGNLKEAAVDGVLSAGPLKLLKGGATAAKAARGGATLASALRSGGDDAAKFTIRGALGPRASKKGEELVAKQFRLTPTQQTNFLNRHKVKATQVLSDARINSSDDIGEVLPTLYDEFAGIAKSVPTFKTKEVSNALTKIYKPLTDSVLPAQQQLGAQLKQVSKNIVTKYGDDIPSDVVNSIRQAADEATRFTLRGTSDEGVNVKTATTLRKLMQQKADDAGLKATDGSTFKEVGAKISQFEDLAEITGRQEFLGSGSLPLSLPNLLGAGAGGAAFGPVGSIAALGLTQAVNSNAGRRAITQGTQKLGGTLTGAGARGATTKGIATNAARNLTAGSGIGAILGSQLDNQSLGNIIQPSMDTSANNMSQISNDISDPSIPQEQPQSNAIDVQGIALQLINKGASLEEVQQVIEELTTINAIQDGSFFQPEEEEQELTAAQATRAASAQNALNDIPIIEQAIADGSLGGAKALPGSGTQIGRRLLGTENLDAALFNIADNILRARSGAATPEPEVKRFMEGFLPSPLDSEQAKRQKLQRAVAELQSYTNPQGAATGTLQEALSQGGFQ